MHDFLDSMLKIIIKKKIIINFLDLLQCHPNHGSIRVLNLTVFSTYAYMRLSSLPFPFHMSIIQTFTNTHMHAFVHSRNTTWHMAEMTSLLKADLCNVYVLVRKYSPRCAGTVSHDRPTYPKLTKYDKFNNTLRMLTPTGVLLHHFYASPLFSFQMTTKALSHAVGEWCILEARC